MPKPVHQTVSAHLINTMLCIQSKPHYATDSHFLVVYVCKYLMKRNTSWS